MSIEILKKLLDTLALPLAYRAFGKGKLQEAPYLVYYETGTDDFVADNVVYYSVPTYSLEVYCDKKDVLLEQRIERLLTTNDLPFEKEELYSEQERLTIIKYYFGGF